MREALGVHGKIESYLGVEQHQAALKNADFVVNAIQVGLYKLCTVIDFEIPKKYGLNQTIGDTLGIGGIMRALRTIPVLDEISEDMRKVCPSHQLEKLGMEDRLEGRRELIAGINHMAWLLELRDRYGNDLYPELIKKYNIEYPRRCENQIDSWKKEYQALLVSGVKGHTRSIEYASHIMEAIVSNNPYKINGNVLNTGHLITNLPENACVEVPCLVDGGGIHPCFVGELPVQLAAMNMTNINVQLITMEAARTRKLGHIYQAAMLDPHTASELDIDIIKKMVDELIAATVIICQGLIK